MKDIKVRRNGRSVDNSDSLFYVGSVKSINTAVSVYSTSYSKNEIVDFLDTIRKDLKTTNLKYVDSKGNDITVPDSVKKVFGPNPSGSYYSMRKDQLMEVLAYFNSDNRNENLRKHERKMDSERLLELVAKAGAVSALEVCKMLGKDAVIIESNYYWRRKVVLRSDIRNFRTVIAESRYSYTLKPNEVYLRLPARMVGSAVNAAYPMLPSVSDPNPDKSEEIVVVNRMHKVGAQLSIASAMLEAGTITLGVSKLMAKADRKRFLKAVQIDSVSESVDNIITSGINDGEDLSLESVTLLGFLYDNIQSEYSHTTGRREQAPDPAHIVMNIMQRNRECLFRHSQMIKMLLPCIVGLTSSIVRTLLNKTVMECIYASLSIINDKEWIDVNNVVHDAYRRLYLKNKELLCPEREYWPALKFQNIDEDLEVITPGNVVRYVTMELVRGYIYFLTSIGILETSVCLRPRTRGESVYDCLRHTRLTPLGMYALDKGPYVDITVDDTFIHNYELVDNPLIVVALNPDNPYNSWLNKIGTPRGNRWIVTPGSFLTNCQDADELDVRINDFRKYICDKLTPGWEGFFRQLKDNVGSGSLSLEATRYVVCIINPENEGLQRLLITDPELRQMIIRAEGYRILVPQTMYDMFRITLRRHGYLV